jgi:hypothetical protein
MERNLVLIRHTKSDWSHAGLTDFERPLRADRTDDAKRMSKKLKQLKLYSDLLSSARLPNERDRRLNFFVDALEYDYSRLQFEMRCIRIIGRRLSAGDSGGKCRCANASVIWAQPFHYPPGSLFFAEACSGNAHHGRGLDFVSVA